MIALTLVFGLIFGNTVASAQGLPPLFPQEQMGMDIRAVFVSEKEGGVEITFRAARPMSYNFGVLVKRLSDSTSTTIPVGVMFDRLGTPRNTAFYVRPAWHQFAVDTSATGVSTVWDGIWMGLDVMGAGTTILQARIPFEHLDRLLNAGIEVITIAAEVRLTLSQELYRRQEISISTIPRSKSGADGQKRPAGIGPPPQPGEVRM